MGNRTALNLVTSEQTRCLFEGNNSLPYFWLLMLDRAAIEIVKPQWQACEAKWNSEDAESEDGEDDEPEGGEWEDEGEDDMDGEEDYPIPIRVTPAQFRERAVRGRTFLMANSPASVALFDDFIRFIDAQLQPDSQIEIDIYEISHFYDSLDEFFDMLVEMIEEVENGKTGITDLPCEGDGIGDGTGFACTEEFEACPSYREAMKNRR